MKKSRLRVGLSIVVVLVACCVAGFELMDSLEPDLSVEAQIHKLDSYWASRRRAAATELAQFTNQADKVVPALVKALGDPDTDVRLNALESLKLYAEKAKPAVPATSQMLQNDPDGKIRRRAAALLGAIKDQDQLPILIKALDDRDPAVRLEATRSFGWFPPAIASGPVIDKLLPGLEPDYPEEVRDATIETLASLAREQERVARVIAVVSAKDPSPLIRNKAVGIMKKPTFAFQIPALIAALDDSSPQVRLTAGTNLAWVGMKDDRIVPALCRAALKADDATREGIAANIDILILEKPGDNTLDEALARKYQSAIREFQSVLENRDAAARERIISVLCRMAASCQKSGHPALLEPARDALKAVLARIEDEKEEVSLRLHAMTEWSTIQQMGDANPAGPAESRPAAKPSSGPSNCEALWIASLGGLIKSPAVPVRSRALEILLDDFKDPFSAPSHGDSWRKIVPALAVVTRSQDPRVCNAALVLLGKLGPEAAEALPALRTLAHDSTEAAVRSAAEGAIESISSIEHLKAKDPARRIAAAETLGQLGWPASSGVPALISNLKDPEIKVRIAAANALCALAKVSGDAVSPLASALKGEADAGVRAAIVDALEAIASGTPPVLEAHRSALHDPDPAVRAAAATFLKVPTDDSVVAALASALGDPSDDVRLQASGSLTEVMFANPAVIAALVKGLGDNKERKSVMEALGHHLETTSDQADFSQVRGNLPGLSATLNAAIPALARGLDLKNAEINPLVYGLLGRIVSFSSLSRDADLRKAIEPALQIYLKGLDETTPAIRQEILDRLEAVPIRREDIVSALRKFLEKPDLPPEDRQTALVALKEQSAPGGSGTHKGPSRKKGARGALTRIGD